MKDVILTAGLTLAAALGEEITADGAAKRHTGTRVRGVLSAEWWNSSKTLWGSVMSYSTLLKPEEAFHQFIHLLGGFFVLRKRVLEAFGPQTVSFLETCPWKLALHCHRGVIKRSEQTNKQISSPLLQRRREPGFHFLPSFLLFGHLRHLQPCVPFICSSGSLQE